ncbi:MAG TPA: choice-of-anchor tandem repeat GloVer-containing protein [Candidatus Binatia bacterium]|nr:choice-of-anchor tandem repeat GloVer-containing protein [Candidatus Binatia bacterium]
MRPLFRISSSCVAALAMLAFLVTLTAAAGGQSENVLYSFTDAGDGASPFGNLVADSRGNYFGTTPVGGSYAGVCQYNGCGNVFELSPNGSGGWVETVLYDFTGGADGAGPEAGLTFDGAGNLYGTTTDGGNLSNTNCGLITAGCGVVFKLSPNGDGTWTESVLYAFQGKHDGFLPQSTVSFDAAGNLYGAADLGGAGYGTVFQLSPNGSGGWTFNLIHAFTNGVDGGRPAALIVDGHGNLFATTTQGGKITNICRSGCGSLIEFSPNGSGGWTPHLLHDFTGAKDGGVPWGISLDANGNLFGSALYGGNSGCSGGEYPGCGVIFEFSPVSGGGWSPHIPYSFTGANDGGGPQAPLAFDTAGNVYATSNVATDHSCPGSCGAIVKLTPSGGSWSETTLYTFTGATDGAEPVNNGVILDASGNLFGTTQFGGTDSCYIGGLINGCGVVFEIKP